MNKLIIIAFIALSVSAELRTLASADEPMMFNATALRTFDFIQNTESKAWGNGIFLGADAIASDACSSYTGFNMQFPVNISNTTETTGLGVEICMTIPANESMRNEPAGKTFLISNRFEEAQNWGTPGEQLSPAVTVEDFFNTTNRAATNYTWFTA